MGYPMMGQLNSKMYKADGDGTPDYNTGPPIDGTHPGDFGPGIDGPGGTNSSPPPPGGGTTPGAPPTSGGGLPPWVTNQMNNFSGALSNPLMGPGLVTALQQYHQAHQYTDMAERYASQLDPFGKERGGYQDRLRDSYDHPETVLNDPAHMAELNHGLDAVTRKNASAGLLGSGAIDVALQDYAHTSDADWLTKYRQGLMPLTGEQFGPDAAGRMLGQGLTGRMGAENNAVGNLMAPFMNQARNNQANGNNPNGPAGNPNGSGRSVPSPADVARGAGSVSGPASQWIQDQIRQGRTVDPNDPHVQQAIVEQTPQNQYSPPGSPTGSEGDNTDIMNNYGGSQPWQGNNYDPSMNYDPYEQGGGGNWWENSGGSSLDDINFDIFGGGP